MELLRRWAKALAGFPRWVTVPAALMVGVSLLLLLTWLYLTRSVGTVRVPSVDGRDLDRARGILAERGLSYEVVRTSSMKTPEGTVIRQVPPAGARMKENRAVELHVSQGAEYVRVPDLRGRTPLAARSRLYRRSGGEAEQVGPLLTLGNLARVYSERQEGGTILLQQPGPGRRVLRGSRVDLLVSKGEWPRRTVVPHLIGRPLEEAKRTLAQHRLSLKDVRYRHDRDRPPSVVLNQSPPPRRIVPRERPVTLTVNLERVRPAQRVRYTLVRINPPLSPAPGWMRVVRRDLRGTETVFSDTVPPGRPVEFTMSMKGDAELTLYWNDSIRGFRHLEAGP